MSNTYKEYSIIPLEISLQHKFCFNIWQNSKDLRQKNAHLHYFLMSVTVFYISGIELVCPWCGRSFIKGYCNLSFLLALEMHSAAFSTALIFQVRCGLLRTIFDLADIQRDEKE